MKRAGLYWLTIGLLVAGCGGRLRFGGSRSSDPVADADTPRAHLFVRLPPGASEATLGTWWDRDLRPLSGARAFPVTAVVVEETAPGSGGRIESQYVRVTSSDELRANAALWGGVTGSVGAIDGTAHAVFRARLVTRVARIDPTLRAGSPPREARYYLSAIETGRLIEYHFAGDESVVSGGLRAVLPEGTASVTGGRTSAGVSVSVTMLGLRPRSADALLGSESDAATAFVEDESDPVPVIAEFVSVGGTGRVRVRVARVEFVGAGWDVGNGAPEIRVRIGSGGRTVGTLTGPDDTLSWAVPTAAGTLPGALAVSAATPLQLWFQDEDMMNHDDAGSFELTSLSTSPEPQCFGAGEPIGSAELPRVRFCLVVAEGE